MVGISPLDVARMSPWQSMRMINGWSRAHATDELMDEAQADEIWEWLQTKPNHKRVYH